MRRPLGHLALSMLVFLVLATQFSATAQTPATNVNATHASAVAVEVKVLAIPATGSKDLELFFPESPADESGRPGGFAIVLSDDEAQALVRDPGTIAIHNLRLPPSTGKPAKFRVEARTAVTASYPVNPPYFEVALGFEISGRAISDSVALSTESVVQIRRGSGAGAGVAALLLETTPIRNNIQVPAGRSILLGGFFTAADSARVPEVTPKPDSPILSYVLSKAPKSADDPEIVVLLIPRIVDAPDVIPDRVPDEVAHRVEVQFRHHPRAVRFHGLDADREGGRDFFVRPSLGQELHHLALPRTERSRWSAVELSVARAR